MTALTEQLAEGLNSPICLTWEWTYACDLQCVHCLSSSGRRDPDELSTEQMKAVVDQLKAAQSLLAETSTEPPKAASTLPEQVPPAVTRSAPETAALPQRQAWHEKFQLRGYTQLRINEIVSGASIAPPGRSRTASWRWKK